MKYIISQLEVGIFLLMPKKKGDFSKDLQKFQIWPPGILWCCLKLEQSLWGGAVMCVCAVTRGAHGFHPPRLSLGIPRRGSLSFRVSLLIAETTLCSGGSSLRTGLNRSEIKKGFWRKMAAGRDESPEPISDLVLDYCSWVRWLQGSRAWEISYLWVQICPNTHHYPAPETIPGTCGVILIFLCIACLPIII